MTYLEPRKVNEPSNLSKPLAAGSNLNNAKLRPIEIFAELDFGSYFYTVKYGEAIVGMYRKSGDCWTATSTLSDRLKTFHNTSGQAKAALIEAYAKKSVNIPESTLVFYRLILETEVDANGVILEYQKIVELDSDVSIDWQLWA
ncbi:MAG: hypothetical protein ACFBSE_23725, partial [Prochloraceae cyanobacterium]